MNTLKWTAKRTDTLISGSINQRKIAMDRENCFSAENLQRISKKMKEQSNKGETVSPVIPNVLIVPPILFESADRVLNTREIRKLGAYIQYQYRDKIWWERWDYPIVPKKKQITLKDIIREVYPYSYLWYRRLYLPKAMRKAGFKIRFRNIHLWRDEYITYGWVSFPSGKKEKVVIC